MKEKTSKFLLTLAGFAAFTAAASADVVYPGCPTPPVECCVCDVLPDTYNYGVMFGAAGCETKKIIFSGLVQTDYQFISVDDRKANTVDPTDVNNFYMRKIRLGVEADLGENWRGVAVMDFAGKDTRYVYTGNGGGSGAVGPIEQIPSTTLNKHGIFGLYKAYVEKYCSGNFFRVGYKKVNFVREENIEDYDLKTIERSVATLFFNGDQLEHVASGGDLGFGERHVGLFLDGMYDHFGYSAALVNGYQGARNCSEIFDNELGVFADIHYVNEFNCMDVEIGVNAGYKPKGENRTLRYNTYTAWNNPASSTTIPSNSIKGGIWAVNPYITINWNGWSLLAEVIGAKIEHGAADGMTDASPIGATGVLSYMWNDCFEIVGRGSYLNTDHHGVRISSVIPCAGDTTGVSSVFPAGDLYNKVDAWYIGFNYYLLNRAVKFSAAYEFSRFKNRHSGITKTVNNITTLDPDGFEKAFDTNNNEKANAHTVRAQLQLVF